MSELLRELTDRVNRLEIEMQLLKAPSRPLVPLKVGGGLRVGAYDDQLLTLWDKCIQGRPGFVVAVPLGADVLVLVVWGRDGASEYHLTILGLSFRAWTVMSCPSLAARRSLLDPLRLRF